MLKQSPGGAKGLVFQKLKEHRGNYFVEYLPARAGDYFSTLSLVFLKHVESSEISKLMEQECSAWMKLYPVPLMVTAFDDTGSLIDLTANRGCDHLIGIVEAGKPVYHWKLLKNEDFHSGPLQESHLLEVYNHIPYSTAEERWKKATRHTREIRIGIVIIAIWSIVFVATVQLILAKSRILGYFMAIYAIGKVVYQALKMLGCVKKNGHEKQKDAEKLKMRHYYYHCELNPEGFNRLKAENFEREAREQIRKEAEEIKRGQTSEPGDGK